MTNNVSSFLFLTVNVKRVSLMMRVASVMARTIPKSLAAVYPSLPTAQNNTPP